MVPYFFEEATPQLGWAQLGGGDDTVSGGAGIVWGGAGNDVFHNSGVGPGTGGTFAVSRGQGGNDIFIDTYGSTRYYGGSGNDIFTNLSNGLTHANPAADASELDHDIVLLESGNDTAIWVFAGDNGEYHPAGVPLDPRIAEIDGGAGRDLLVLEMTGLPAILPTDRIDFRDLNSGSLTIGNATFSDFERFDLTFGDSTIDTLLLGNLGDRLIWFDTPMESSDPAFDIDYDPTRAPDGPLRLYGLAGNDFIVGSYERDVERIFGGNGNDTISGGGSGPGGSRELLVGGNGHDVLYDGAIAVSNDFNLTMVGGAGNDMFVVSGPQSHTRIRDFAPGEDQFVFDFTGGYSLLETGHRSVVANWQGLTILTDTDSLLRFEFQITDRFGQDQTYTVTYQRDSGRLFLDDEAHHLDEGPLGTRIATLVGAPDLEIGDFGFFDWQTFA